MQRRQKDEPVLKKNLLIKTIGLANPILLTLRQDMTVIEYKSHKWEYKQACVKNPVVNNPWSRKPHSKNLRKEDTNKVIFLYNRSQPGAKKHKIDYIKGI